MPTGAQCGNGFTDPANPDYDRGHCDQSFMITGHGDTESRRTKGHKASESLCLRGSSLGEERSRRN
jgi:hypothetical protein